jgi:putative transposase
MVEYLKAENRILREKLPRCITVTPRERNRLVRLGTKLGAAIKGLITIVTPRTFARWVAGTDPGSRAKPVSARKLGRPRTAEDIRALILRLARENGWGYARVLGELKKLGIHTVSKTTVANILREAGLDPGPKRGEGTWSDFVARHAATLWACDFLTVRSLTIRGCVDLFVLFFVHIGSRRAFVAGVTANPDAAWVTQQARNASMQMADWRLPASRILIDYDSKFPRSFDAVFAAEGAKVQRVGPQAPNLNAVAERSRNPVASSASIISWSAANAICGTCSGNTWITTTTPNDPIRRRVMSRCRKRAPRSHASSPSPRGRSSAARDSAGC